jgi:orotidine-5'-phosphate decarboxylase
MTHDQLYQQIRQKSSYLCVGLDTDVARLPTHLLDADDPIFTFNKAIIDATHDLCVAYKPNTAFYEAQGSRGWEALEKTVEYIESIGNQHFIIADAKRGDIGNTSKMYAQAFFERMNFDALTVAPYMGADSVQPFLGFAEKWVILLALTSNEGSKDFQLPNNFYQNVLKTAQTWASPEQMMFVVGATHPDKFAEIRQLAPDYFFLVPGVGAQGGSLSAVSAAGMNSKCGLLVNSSREILYASEGENFAQAARKVALQTQEAMKIILIQRAEQHLLA